MKIRSFLAAAFVAANTVVALPNLAVADTQIPSHDIGNIVDTALNAFRTTQAIMETAAKDPHVVAYYQAHPEIQPVCTSGKNRELIRGYYPDFFTPLEEKIGAPRAKFSLENLGYRLSQAKACLEVSIAAYTERREQIEADYMRRMSGEDIISATAQPDALGSYIIDQRIQRFETSKAEVEKMLTFYGGLGVNIGRQPSDPSPWPR